MRDERRRQKVEPIPAPVRAPVATRSLPTRAGGPDRMLALQRTAGNRAVVRMLAQRRPGAPLLQRTVRGYEGPQRAREFERLREDLAGMLTSPARLAKLEDLFQGPTPYDIDAVLNELEQVDESPPTTSQTSTNATSPPAPSPSAAQKPAAAATAPPQMGEKDEDSDEGMFDYEHEDYALFEDKQKEAEEEDDLLEDLGQGVRAVVVWAGSKLHPAITKKLQSLLEIGDLLAKHKRNTQAVAGELAKHPSVRVEPDVIQQALDQELESHTEAVRRIVARLGKFGIQPTVLRPSDNLLLVPGGVHIDPRWVPYGDPEKLTALEPSPGVKTLLITVGHGAPTGHTQFASEFKTGLSIAAELNLAVPAGAFMYIPLQCYPQAAVKRWKTETETKQKRKQPSVSIPGVDRSDDREMLAWINKTLQPALKDWLEQL